MSDYEFPLRDGVGISCVAVPPLAQLSEFASLADFLARRFPTMNRAVWQRRLAGGNLWHENGKPLAPTVELTKLAGQRLYYYREVENETPLPFWETILYQDERIVVADKPHFLPVMPGGDYLQNTLLVRLRRALDLPELTPVHRIDRETAGLVLLVKHAKHRAAYHELFRSHQVTKHYHAIAPYRADYDYPLRRVSRLAEIGDFFRMGEVDGAANAESLIEIEQICGAWARYRLTPISGKRHQLRVHMAALGMPIAGDTLYPDAAAHSKPDYAHPLQLLAHSLRFTDPISGVKHEWQSAQRLHDLMVFAAKSV